MSRNLFFSILLLFISYISSLAQDSLSTKKVKILPVPTFGYSPETKTYIGAVSLFTLNFYQDQLTRTSNAKIEFAYTWNKQIIAETQWNYFFREEAWFTRGWIHFSKYPDLYYGIGADTQEEGEIKFESNRVLIDIDALKKIKNNVFGGVGIRYFSYANMSFYDNVNPYPELESSSSFGLKLIFLKDSRNNILNPSTGSYLELINTNNIDGTFYSKIGIDWRRYFTMKFNRNHVVAGRFYSTFTFGEPPFYDYSLIGGDRFVRGYLFGRFRDYHFSTLQLEYRMKLFWRLGLSGFGGMSMIYHQIDEIDQDAYKPNVGMGLRFLVDKTENTNLRIDYALGSEGQDGFYITFGESF